MGRPSARLVAIGLVGAGFGLLSEVIQSSAGITAERILIDFAVGQAYLVGGLVAWQRDPANAAWKVMTGIGLAWFIGNYAAAPEPVVHAFGVVFADTDAILLILLVLSYPKGHLEGTLHRGVVLAAAIGLTAANVLLLATGIGEPSLLLGLGLTAAMLVLVPRRWFAAVPQARRALAPALVAAIATLLAVGTAIVAQLAELPAASRQAIRAVRDVGVLAIPIGFVIGSFQLAEDRVRESRARLVAAADLERRRLERDLHDGAQQRLVALALTLRTARRRVRPDDVQLADVLDFASAELKAGIEELRELAHGIHPMVLTESGLAGALESLAERSMVPAVVTEAPAERFSPAVEATAYFVASEALTNAAKHAGASRVSITARARHRWLRLVVTDDGRGGADLSAGTGLTGLSDRVTALGGRLQVRSRAGAGTSVIAEIPLEDSIADGELGIAPWPRIASAAMIGRDDQRAHRG